MCLWTGDWWVPTFAAELESSQRSVNKSGSPGHGWQVVHPHCFVWWICWTVDCGWGSSGFIWAASEVEHLSACYLRKVRVISCWMSNYRKEEAECEKIGENFNNDEPLLRGKGLGFVDRLLRHLVWRQLFHDWSIRGHKRLKRLWSILDYKCTFDVCKHGSFLGLYHSFLPTHSRAYGACPNKLWCQHWALSALCQI